MNRIEKIWFFNAILFIIIFLYVSFFNRLAEDDFLFLETVKQRGIWDATLAHYYSWNTRWFAIGWLNVWYWLISNGIPLFVFNCLSLFFMIFCFYTLIKNINVKLSQSQKFLYSILFCLCFFFSTFNIPDAWFWINSTTMYLWNIGFLCLGISIVLKRERLNILDYLILSVSGLYIGGASEPFIITLLPGLALVGVFTNKFKFLQFHFSKIAIVIYGLFILISFLIAYTGQGHEARSNALPHTSIILSLEKSFYYILKILAWHFHKHIIPLILFSMPWLYLGYLNQEEKKQNRLLTLYTKGILVIIILTYLNILPIVYLMGDYGPSRAWTPISFYICIITTFLFYRTGQQLQLKYFSTVRLFEITGIIAFCFLLVTGIYYVRTASEYTKAYDDKKQFNELPESGWLHSAKLGGTPPN